MTESCLRPVVGIKLTSSGPVFFFQERCGKNGRRFKMPELRTMYTDAEERKLELMHLNEMDGPVFKIKDDPRITPVGGFLRKWSVDVEYIDSWSLANDMRILARTVPQVLLARGSR